MIAWPVNRRERLCHTAWILALALAAPARTAGQAAGPESAQPSAPAAASAEPPELDQQDPELSATARVSPEPRTARRIEREEARTTPGAFGDPFRAVQALPGVLPLASGLPYIYVRGAPPASTLYYYDDIPLPSLFHVALGPAVIHPAMLGTIDLYSGVPPARYGRHTGGVIAGQRRMYGDSDVPAFGEIELRAIDANGLLYVPIGGGGLTLAGRYGYPGLIVSAFNDDITIAYWDYQMQLSQPLGRRLDLEVSVFGAYDRLKTGADSDGFESTFHRADLRVVRRTPSFEYGAAALLGYDATSSQTRTTLDSQLADVQTQRLSPRLWWAWRFAEDGRLRVGADMVGVVGKLQPPRSSAELAYGFADETEQSTTEKLYAQAAARNALGAYAELAFLPLPRLETAFGARADLWLTGRDAQGALSPRVVVTHMTSDTVTLHAGAALTHQPAVFLLPLAGVADIALAHGLQRAVQSEVGVAIESDAALRGELQLFLHDYDALLFPELALERATGCGGDFTRLGAPCSGSATYPRASARSYGAELLLSRPESERVSGWISYTLSRSHAEDEAGQAFTPRFDLRHLANLVLRVRIISGLSVGARAFARSGQVVTEGADTGQRVARRLPGFYRFDARASWAWSTSVAELELSLEWANLTFTREPLGFACGLDVTTARRPPPDSTCSVRYAPALVIPNLGLRAQF